MAYVSCPKVCGTSSALPSLIITVSTMYSNCSIQREKGHSEFKQWEKTFNSRLFTKQLKLLTLIYIGRSKVLKAAKTITRNRASFVDTALS